MLIRILIAVQIICLTVMGIAVLMILVAQIARTMS